LGNLTKLLQNAKVQKELGLTSQQMDEIKSIAAGGQSEQKEVFDKNSPISMAEVQRMKGLQALILDVDARHQERIMKVLSDSQQARVLELRIQTSGARSLLFEDVAQHLALTREQRRSVNALIMDPGNPLPSKNELEAKAKSLLTNEQVEEFEKMKGKKIDLEPEKRD
jgi:DNA-directed RNA polymerase sigma subunit (sigma70/sigma32)